MSTVNLTRRGFFTGATAGLVLGFALPGCRAGLPLDDTINLGDVLADGELSTLNAWLQIAPNGVAVVQMGASEMGQGVFTSLPMILAEELDMEWSMVRAESAPAHKAYNHSNVDFPGTSQVTGGSLSVRGYWDFLRQAGASARMMLIEAASLKWGVNPATCSTEAGKVICGERSATYGELAADAALLPPPSKVTLKDPKDFKIIGTSPPRLDLPSKVNGTAVFGIDVQVDGMLVGTVMACPTYGGTLDSFDDAEARQSPGVVDIVQVDDAIVVVADTYPHAKAALALVKPTWNTGEWGDLDDAKITLALDAALAKSGKKVESHGKVGETDTEAVYETPYLEHAPLEPLNATAWVREDAVDVWVPTQAQAMVRNLASKLTGVGKDNVHVHTTFLGGGFGRKGFMDFPTYAIEASRMLGAPVKVIWSREECFGRGFYRPRVKCLQKAALGADGLPSDWWVRFAGQNLAEEVLPAFLANSSIGMTIVSEGFVHAPYHVPNYNLEYARIELPIDTGWWRSVYASNHGFARECFLDELAHKAGQDPVVYRLAMLEDKPRFRACLELAVEKAGPKPEGMGRGVAMLRTFGSIVAEVADVSVVDGVLKVHKVTAAIDAGQVVHPNTVKAQVSGALGMGLSAALGEQLNFSGGAVTQTNFHMYPVMGLAMMPEIDVHIVPSTESPGGVGEPGLPPIAAAVCNAIFDATGTRIRSLPISSAQL